MLTKLFKAILIILIPVFIILILTIIGLLRDDKGLVGFSGLLLFSLLFLGFMFVDKLLKKFKSIDEKITKFVSENENISVIKNISYLFKLLSKIPLNIASLIRGILASLSFWIIDFYLALVQGNFNNFIDKSKVNFFMSLSLTLLGTYDSLKDKTIDDQSLPTRIISIFGFYQFIRNYFLLSVIICGYKYFDLFNKFLTNPLWFTDRILYLNLVIYTLRSYYVGATFIFIIFPIFGLIYSKGSRKSPNLDAPNLAIALRIICIWFLSFPIVYFLSEGLNFNSYMQR